MLALVPYRNLATTRPFPELISAELVVRDAGRTAIACALPHLSWPGRAVYDGRRIRHRVALYDHADLLIAVFDEAAFRVNDLSFHPTDPVLAIATGSYDGGYSFEGALLLWNWVTGESRSVFDGSRELTRCRWEPDGTVTVLARPDNDDEEDASNVYGATLDVSKSCSLEQLRRCEGVDFGFVGEPGDDGPPVLLESRAVIWDLAWTLDGRLAVARDDGCVELWSVATGRREHEILIGGQVVQLLRQPDRVLAHVMGARSELYELRGNELVSWLELAVRHACSVDACGRVLARDIDQRTRRRDQVWTASKQLLIDADLGHYDAFNHFLRVDGVAELFLLRGTPASSHEHKHVCVIDPGDGVVRTELPWDVTPEHRMTGAAVALDDDLVCCYRVHESSGGGAIRIERRARPGGDTVWRHEVPASAIAMIAWPSIGGIVAALVDGTLCILGNDGTVMHEERFTIDDVPTIPTALAVHDETLAVGTIDGRISLLSLR